MIVPDANILVGWALSSHPLAERCSRLWEADNVWVVPRLWRYELWSVLTKMVWAKFLRPGDANSLYQTLFDRLCDNECDPPSSEDRELLSKFSQRAVSLDEMLLN